MWVFVPRVRLRTLLLAAVVAAPAVLLGALSNLIVLSELVALDVWPGPESGAGAWDALREFRSHVEVLLVGVFLLLLLATLTVVYFTANGALGLNLWGSLLVGLLAAVPLAGLTLAGPSVVSARIGAGTAAWGVAWILVGLFLFAFLRPLRLRHWPWVATGVGAYTALVSFLFLLAGLFFPVDMLALVALFLALLASFIVVARRHEVGGMWAARPQSDGPRPPVQGGPMIAVYLLLVFGLMGMAYQHHFDYRPQAELWHFVLMGGAFLAAVPLCGLLVRRTNRRTFLLAVPLAAFVPIILQLVQVQHEVLWAIAVAQGIMFATVLFVLQYVAEAAGRVTRGLAVLCSVLVVVATAAGGTLVAQLSAMHTITPDILLVLQFVAFFSALVIALSLPDAMEPVREEEELEEYLEVAKRVSEHLR